MRVLLTNDDGIEADGIRTLAAALAEVEGIELDVVAPDVNQSATARSITTREPLWVEEVEMVDGVQGYAVGGTPVDCVRIAELGLVGSKPELIVSGINHGSNLGDDVTYSGTVAAAFEGILLGLPAIAVSQQSESREMGYRGGRHYEFGVAAALTAGMVERVLAAGMSEGTLLNVNVPGGAAGGVEVARLGKRLYDDELRLVEEKGSRRRYEIYGHEPGHEEEEGTDLAAVAAGRIAVTPIHFDLTAHEEFEALSGWGLEEMLERAEASAA